MPARECRASAFGECGCRGLGGSALRAVGMLMLMPTLVVVLRPLVVVSLTVGTQGYDWYKERCRKVLKPILMRQQCYWTLVV